MDYKSRKIYQGFKLRQRSRLRLHCNPYYCDAISETIHKYIIKPTNIFNINFFQSAHCYVQGTTGRFANLGIRDNLTISGARGPQVVALACKMVGGGSDGSLDLCARVCLIDEHENIIFHSYVKPPIPVTNCRLVSYNYFFYRF